MRKGKVIEKLREPEVLKTIADLRNLGLSEEEIKNEVNKRYELDINQDTIGRILRKYSMTRKEILISDREFKETYKVMLTDMIRQGKESSKIMEDTLKFVYDKLLEIARQEASSLEIEKLKWYIEELKNTEDWVKVREQIIKIIQGFKLIRHREELLAYITEVCTAIRALNDNLRTRNDILKSLELETKEVKLNAVQSVELVMSNLKELERNGMIKIMPTYYELETVKEEKNARRGKERREQNRTEDSINGESKET